MCLTSKKIPTFGRLRNRSYNLRYGGESGKVCYYRLSYSLFSGHYLEMKISFPQHFYQKTISS